MSVPLGHRLLDCWRDHSTVDAPPNQEQCTSKESPLREGLSKTKRDAKAQFRSLTEPWADTGTSTGRLMLAVLGGLADVARPL